MRGYTNEAEMTQGHLWSNLGGGSTVDYRVSRHKLLPPVHYGCPRILRLNPCGGGDRFSLSYVSPTTPPPHPPLLPLPPNPVLSLWKGFLC